ncbi:LOG family protein [Thalassoglobus sp. JC818]|uniref:LOG family protein n=1 Tax=Thalassoglobus sp. JC818 TaxID=3232136 RepID=UPI003459F6EE
MAQDETSSQPNRQAAVSLANEGQVRDVLAESILGLWDVVNNLTRLKPSRRERFRVTLFGSARIAPGTFAYEETKRCAEQLAKLGCDIITGGGPGLMQAANEGAAIDPDRSQSIGIRVDLPFEQEVNSFVGQAFEHRTFFTRLQQFVIQSDAFVVAPGGIGTVLETLMVWQLLQVQHLVGTPLILVGEMWPGLVDWARSSMTTADPPLASEEDMSIPRCVKNADEAIEILKEYHSQWANEFGSESNSETDVSRSSSGTEM